MPSNPCSRQLAILSIVLISLFLSNVGRSVLAQGESEEEGSGPITALVGGRILTMSDPGLIEGTILIQDGKITDVGSDIEVPADAKTIDVGGLTISPGLIDARSVLWLTPRARTESASDGSLSILDGVDSFSDDWKLVAQSGVTAVAVQPSGTSRLSGRGAVLSVGPGNSVQGLTIKPDAWVQAGLGLSGSTSNSVLRYQDYTRLKSTLESAKKYKEEWEKYREALKKYEETQSESESNDKDATENEEKAEESEQENQPQRRGPGQGGPGPRPPSRRGTPPGPSADDKDEESKDEADSEEKAEDDAKKSESDSEDSKKPERPKEPKRDEAKEVLVKVLNAEIPLRLEAHREDDLKNALKLADEYEFEFLIEGVSDPGLVRERLESERIPMVLGPMTNTGNVPSYRQNRSENWLEELLVEDSRWALGTYGSRPEDSARLRAEAAQAVAAGIPEAQVLNAITRGAAEILGVDNQVGSIAEGLRADLVAFAGDPLDLCAPVRLVFSCGEMIYQSDASTTRESADLVQLASDTLVAPLPGSYLIRSARILQADGQFEAGALRIQDGSIVRSGATLEPVEGEVVFDLGEAWVTPGLTASLGTFGFGAPSTLETGPDASRLRASDGFDPTNAAVRAQVRGGVLRTALTTDPSFVVSGTMDLTRHAPREAVLAPNLGVTISLTEASRNSSRYPSSLPSQVDLATRFLQSSGGRDTSVELEVNYLLPRSITQRFQELRTAQAQRLRDGTDLTFFRVNSVPEINAALELTRAFSLKTVLVGAGELDKALDVILNGNVRPQAIVLEPSELSYATIRQRQAVVQAQEEGIAVLFTASAPNELRLLAASAVTAGMDPESVILGLVQGPALLSEQNGLWSVGSPADVVIWSGSPLDLRSAPLCVIVGGDLAP